MYDSADLLSVFLLGFIVGAVALFGGLLLAARKAGR